MTIRSAPYYWLECNQCGASSTEGSEYAAWRDPEQAADDAEDGGWETRGTHALCAGCGPYCAQANCLSPAAREDNCCDEHAAPAIESAPFSQATAQ